ncbi:MAG: hypothetical protein ACLSDJ_13980 [Butyricimonas faecihominis]
MKTIDKNIGCDISMFNNRLHATFDYYHKSTDPLMALWDTLVCRDIWSVDKHWQTG